MHKVTNDYTPDANGNSNVKVFIRARPPEETTENQFIEVAEEDPRRVKIKDPDSNSKKYSEVAFQFDQVFWSDITQKDIFEEVCKPLVDHVVEGYNCCSFACKITVNHNIYRD